MTERVCVACKNNVPSVVTDSFLEHMQKKANGAIKNGGGNSGGLIFHNRLGFWKAKPAKFLEQFL